MTDRTQNADEGESIDRRTMLRISSAAVASGAAISGMASANRGNGQGGSNG